MVGEWLFNGYPLVNNGYNGYNIPIINGYNDSNNGKLYGYLMVIYWL